MSTETVQTTQSKQPGKQEIKEEVKGTREDGSTFEAKREVKVETKTQDPAAADPTSRIGRAESIVQRNVLWSLGAGVVPIPIVDIIAVTGVQVKMLKELSDLYEVEFSEGIGRKLIASLFAGLGSVGCGIVVGGSIAKLIPGVGTVMGLATFPAFAAAFTRTTGNLFKMHFESGGTFLDLDAHAMRSHFMKEFESSKVTVYRDRAAGR